ncbi:hypothetical protein HaLaN_26996 [Haematococcus lacustris]|uniref:Uncharacterized protein n=1 Tax=Haematococcus lacustris TaxID=44745 RepID=A0A6A0A7F1_HAELA|nr:hypothetical protein HaLaN_26996 [Haematococcus lacustris]
MPADEDGDEGSELDMQELTGGLSYREDVGQAMKPWVAKPARPTGIGRDTSDLDEAAAEAVVSEEQQQSSVARDQPGQLVPTAGDAAEEAVQQAPAE